MIYPREGHCIQNSCSFAQRQWKSLRRHQAIVPYCSIPMSRVAGERLIFTDDFSPGGVFRRWTCPRRLRAD